MRRSIAQMDPASDSASLPNHELALSPDGCFIHYRSRVSARNGQEMATRLAAAIALGRAHQVSQILFDCRGTVFTAGLGAQYEYAYNLARRQGLDRHWRLCLLVSPGDRSYDFQETALLNAGYNVRLLTDFAAASAWLATGPG